MIKPLVSIITLNFNGLEDTINCLNSLKKTKYPNFEVLVVDNGSAVNEANIIRKKFDSFVICYRSEKNKGFTGGNNWALKKTKGKYVVLLNNDTKVDPNWLTPLVNLLEKDTNIAVAQPKILLMQKPNFFDYSGAAGGFIDKYGYPFTRGRIFNTMEKDKGQYDGITNIFWASGAACIIRKSIIKKVGGLFNQNLFAYMEEIDFCWRIWNAGHRVVFTSDSIIYHKVAATAKKNLFKKRFWEHRNNLLILTRNLTIGEAITVLPMRFVFEFLTYIYYLFSGQYKFIGSLFTAHLDFAKKFLTTRIFRIRLQNNNKLLIYPRSIVIDYFLKKRNKFNQLNWSPKGNISFILYNRKPSGGLKVILNQVKKFRIDGYSVRLYTIFKYKLSGKIDGIITKGIINAFFDVPSDVLVSTFWPTAYLNFLLKARKRFYFIQGWEEDFHTNSLLKYLAKYTYTLPLIKITVSRFLKNKVNRISNNKYPLYYIYNPVLNLELFKSEITKSPYSSSKKTKRILSVISWYDREKGPDILAKTVSELKKRHPDYHFTLVSLEKKAYNNIFDSFVHNPSQARLVKLYQKSDVLLATSRSEGFYIPGIEAMACGCVFITSDNGGVREYAKDNFNAIIIKNLDDLWEKNIMDKILSDSKKINKLKVNGYNTAKKYTTANIKALESNYFSS